MSPDAQQRIAIWGAGGHARVVAECAQLLGYRIGAYVESGCTAAQARAEQGIPILRVPGPDEGLAGLATMGITQVALGFGHCQGRRRIGDAVCAGGLHLIKLIHPSATVSAQARVGQGAFIGAAAVLDPGVSIGDFVIVNNHTVVCHDSTVGKATHLCPGAVISGACTIGEQCWIGAGSVLRDHISVADRVYLGCGSVVTGNLEAGVLAYGNPARVQERTIASF